jgi:hypothetical protein
MLAIIAFAFITLVPQQQEKPAVPDTNTFKLRSKDDSLRVEHKTPITVRAPYFEQLELRREYGTTLVQCGTFEGPTIRENGTEIRWTYTMRRPGSGPCSAAGGGSFVAVGKRGTTEIVSSPAR